jgi:hypothetical protein
VLRTSAPLIGTLGGRERSQLRDDFSRPTKDLLAKRVGFVCSNPLCRRPTSGPQDDPRGAVNLGVAAHITAAAPDGPRYDEALTEVQRTDICNGIWLCQSCAKLVDNDEARFPRQLLDAWKITAEAAAAHDLIAIGPRDRPFQAAFSKAEALMPALLGEMRKDVTDHPTTREVILLGKRWSYWGTDKVLLTYYFEDHENLEGKFQVLENLGLVRDIKFNNVIRYMLEEHFVEYLSSSNPSRSAT